MKPFLQQLHAQLPGQPLLADGAMGTMLFAMGVQPQRCLEQFVIERPDWVAAIHSAYVDAGADLLTSHTFGANRLRLAFHGLEKQVDEFNRAAVRLLHEVRETSARDFWIAGCVGPVGKQVDWADSRERSAVTDAFQEQINVLSEAGVELLIFETFSDLLELEAAVQVAKEASDLPVVASMSFGSDGLTLAKQDVAMVTPRLLAAGVDVVGVNCSVGPEQVEACVRGMQSIAPNAIFSAMPNAGLPVMTPDGLSYPVTAEEFASYVPRFVEAGARLVGGCCGTTPEYIAAMWRQCQGIP